MNSNIDLWVLFITGLPGLLALVYQIITGIIEMRRQPKEGKKTDAETKKTEAEAWEIQGKVYKAMIDELQEQVTLLRGDLNNETDLRKKLETDLQKEKSARIAVEHIVLELKEKQQWYEKYIESLLRQMKKANIVPVERPTQLMPE